MEMPSHPPLTEPGYVPDAVRVQILATEHWSLLATRSMIWNESFSRTGMFLTVLSGAVVALALVAQASDFGATFRLFALLILPVVLMVGILTYLRLGEVNGQDMWLVIGMNRLRHAYLDLAPELAPYFVTGHTDDETGAARTHGPDFRITPSRILASTPALVAIIDAVIAGAIAGLAMREVGASFTVSILAVVLGTLVAAALLFSVPLREIRRFRQQWISHFPS